VVLFAFLAIRFVLAAQPLIDGVDFYLVLLYARDLANGSADIPMSRYIYFPGVYTFWKAMYLAADGSLPAVQWAYVGLLVGNGLLVGAILATVTGLWQAGFLAAALYLVAGSRIESLYGCAEPIATLPYLLGLWGWMLLSRRGFGTAGLLSLATGFGLALYTKQQGGLLFMGAAGLLLPQGFAGSSRRYTLQQWLLLPTVAGGVFALAMWMEGGGLSAIARGLQFAADYKPEGSWGEHLVRAWTMTQPFSNFLPTGLVVCLIGWLHRDRLPPVPELLLPALGISLCSALGAMLQFSKRGYLHYALLMLPSLLLIAGLTIDALVRWLVPFMQRLRDAERSSAWTGIALLVALHGAGLPAFAQHAAAQLNTPSKAAGFTERVKETFPPLCRHVPPGSELLLIPSREQVVHWMCGTRAIAYKQGYAWWSLSPDPYLEALSSPDLSYAFVFSDNAGPYEQRFFLENGRAGIDQALKRLGFRDAFTFEGGTLYRREPGGNRHAGS